MDVEIVTAPRVQQDRATFRASTASSPAPIGLGPARYNRSSSFTSPTVVCRPRCATVGSWNGVAGRSRGQFLQGFGSWRRRRGERGGGWSNEPSLV